MLVYVVMHGSQLLLLEAAYRYTYTQVTLHEGGFEIKEIYSKINYIEGLTQGSGVGDFAHFCQLLLLTPVSENPIQPLMFVATSH
jgi:hypothetical protein